MKRFSIFFAAMCLVAAFATACGGSSDTKQEQGTGTATMTASPTATAASPTATAEAPTGPAAAGAAIITIASNSFGEPITVPPGAQITIKNDDSAEHSVTSDTAGKFDVEVEGKEQGTLTAPIEPGEYAFHCTYHPSMHGTLIVK
jgi:plastocyanin